MTNYQPSFYITLCLQIMNNFTKDEKKQANNVSQEMFIQVEMLRKQHCNRDRGKTRLISERKLQCQERKWFSENILKR